jgi:hypothetical protein
MNDNKTAIKPKRDKTACAATKAAARNAYRARIKSLLGRSEDERLADVWQRVYPSPIDPACELPDRQGIIEDLVDFAEALRPGLDGMKTHRLCWLIEKYAACDSCQSGLLGSPLVRRLGTLNCRTPSAKCGDLVALHDVHGNHF